MEDKTNQLQCLKDEVAVALKKQYDGLIGAVSERYDSLSVSQRLHINGKLEILMETISSWQDSTDSCGNHEEPLVINFDYEQARKIREKIGLNKRQLANQIGISPAILGRFESGERIPMTKRGKLASRRYINWLRENGYSEKAQYLRS